MTATAKREASPEDFAFAKLGSFGAWMKPKETPARHQRLWCEALERVERGEIKRLMLFAPPGSAKTTWASRNFVAWYMGRNPDRHVLAATHSNDYARINGRFVRDMLARQDYEQVFPGVGLSADMTAADEWSTNQGGFYVGAGTSQGIAGRRANLLIGDDLIKGSKQADSQTFRDGAWHWWQHDFRSRMLPGAAIVLMNTRWHADDIPGRILPEDYDGSSGWFTARDNGERWYVLNLMALIETPKDAALDPLGRQIGETIWPEFYDPEHWLAQRRGLHPRYWNALYQGRPQPEGGSYFKAEWVQRFKSFPPLKQLRIYGASDYATKEGGGDYTCHVIVGIDALDNIYVLDCWFAQSESDKWVDALVGTEPGVVPIVRGLWRQWEPITHAEERGQIIGSVGPFLRKRMLLQKVFIHRKQFTSVTNKASRARSIQGYMAMLKVFFPDVAEFPATAGWCDWLVTQLLRFDGQGEGVDDGVDALSLIGRMLHELLTGKPDPAPDEPMRAVGVGYDVSLDDLAAKSGTRRERI